MAKKRFQTLNLLNLLNHIHAVCIHYTRNKNILHNCLAYSNKSNTLMILKLSVLFQDCNKSLSPQHFALVTVGLFLDYKQKQIMCSSRPSVSSEEAQSLLCKVILRGASPALIFLCCPTVKNCTLFSVSAVQKNAMSLL